MYQQNPLKVDTMDLAIRVASELLRQNGEIAVSTIRAIPFLTDEQEVDNVVDYLIHNLNAEKHQRKVSSQPILRWEQFIRLRDGEQ